MRRRITTATYTVNEPMSAHHVEITLAQDGKLTLDELPFRAGDKVEVILLARESKPKGEEYPLRGQPIEYVDPAEPVWSSDVK
jgi:hypothetical protein